MNARRRGIGSWRRSAAIGGLLAFSLLSAPSAIATTALAVGQQAPDFSLPDQTGKPVKLSDYRGKKNVVLAFYVLAFTGG